ncbi:hypothetical protein PMIN01_08739 [Paraphaeosphaeria minitans]|uniref:Uncharacterized protein n=1 Tax=Paraphaeosphaeria minitans TaxID=565426 RepID=A0A9P6KNI6_9PLEO|nr:hypothetical protein PMIN01_08739 [Paraphaeosphaeria minitans]
MPQYLTCTSRISIWVATIGTLRGRLCCIVSQVQSGYLKLHIPLACASRTFFLASSSRANAPSPLAYSRIGTGPISTGSLVDGSSMVYPIRTQSHSGELNTRNVPSWNHWRASSNVTKMSRPDDA